LFGTKNPITIFPNLTQLFTVNSFKIAKCLKEDEVNFNLKATQCSNDQLGNIISISIDKILFPYHFLLNFLVHPDSKACLWKKYLQNNPQGIRIRQKTEFLHPGANVIKLFTSVIY